MPTRWTILAVLIMIFFVVAIDCSKDNSPTQPPQAPAAQLIAAPPSVTVSVGGSQSVTISGGTPPYAISSPPGAIATAQLVNPDSTMATLQITGVSVASVSTAVTVRDNSSSAKVVGIPIRVQ
jgi:hypothetical protein